MSSLNFDQSTDYSNKELYQLLRVAELPEYVKTASVDDYDTLQGLPKEAFADEDRRIYPLNSAARTYVSNAYFISKKADIEKLYGDGYVRQLENKIKEAAEIFQIEEDINSYSNEFTKQASSDYPETHLGNFELAGMGAMDLYPVKTAADLRENMDHIVNNIHNYPFEWRTKLAENSVKVAGELGVDEVPDLLLKYAGYFYPDFAGLKTEVWRRSTKLKQAEHKEMYEKISADIENISSSEEVMKLAETLAHIENMEGLYDNVKVAQVLRDPVDMIFTKSIEKVASDLNFVEAHGDKYLIDDLQKVGKDKYEEAFGFDLDPADSTKLAEVFPTMPRSDIKLFEEISGIRPV
jgi:hypothetical protein